MPETSGSQAWFYRGLEAGLESDVHAAADRVIADSPDAPNRECTSGCAFCCHFPVGATRGELDTLATALRRDLSDPTYDRLVERVRRSANELRGVDEKTQAAQRRRCVLLGDDDRCIAYPARPIACRGWNSLSRNACEAGFRGEAFPPPSPDAQAYASGLGVHEALRRAGDGTTHELTRGLAALL